MSVKQTALTCALVAIFVCGCGSKEETTYVGSDGSSVSTSNDGKSMTIKTPEGEAHIDNSGDGKTTFKDDKGNESTIGGGITEAELGVPFYPGSAEKPNASFTATQDGKKNILCIRTTKDDPEKVIAFYKDKVQEGKDATMTAGDMKSATLNGKLDGATIAVTASRQGSADTDISIGITSK